MLMSFYVPYNLYNCHDRVTEAQPVIGGVHLSCFWKQNHVTRNMLSELDSDLVSYNSTASHVKCCGLYSPSTKDMAQNGCLNPTLNGGYSHSQKEKEGIEITEFAPRSEECEMSLPITDELTGKSVDCLERDKDSLLPADKDSDILTKDSHNSKSKDSSLDDPVSHQEVDTDSDQSDEKIISLSEEDLFAGEGSSDLVITNVCSVKDNSGSAIYDSSRNVGATHSAALDTVVVSSDESNDSTHDKILSDARKTSTSGTYKFPSSSGVFNFRQATLKKTASRSEMADKELSSVGESSIKLPGASASVDKKSPCLLESFVSTKMSQSAKSPATAIESTNGANLEKCQVLSSNGTPTRMVLSFLKESLLQKKSMRYGNHNKRKCVGASPFLLMSEEGSTLESIAEVRRPKAAVLPSTVSNEHAEWLGSGKSKESAPCSSGSTSSVVSRVFSNPSFAKHVLNGEENRLGDSGKHIGKKRKVGELPNQSPTSCGYIKRSDVTILSDVSRLIEKEKSGGFVNISSVSVSSVPSCSTGSSGKQQTARKKVTKSSLNSKVGMKQASSNSQPLLLLPRVLPAPAHADSSSSLMVAHVRDSNTANERRENTTVSSATMPTATCTTLGSVSAPGTNSSAEHFLSICGHLVNMEDFKKLIDPNIKNVPQIIQVPLPDGTSRSFTVIFSPKVQTPETNYTTLEGTIPRKPVPAPASGTNASSIPSNVTLSHNIRASLPGTFLLASLPLQRVVPAVSAPAATKTVTSQVTKHSAILPAIFPKSLSHPKSVPMSFSKKTTARTSQFRKIQPRILKKAAPKQNGTTAPAAISSKLEDSVAKDIESDMTIEDVSVLLQRTNPIAAYTPSINDPGHQMSHVHSCVECGDSFSTTVGYTSHMNRMSIVIRYACRFCSLAMAFFNKCAFMSHLRLHTDAGQNEEDNAAFNPKSHTISVSSLPSFLLPAVGPHVFGPTVDDLNAPVDCSECGLSSQNADLLALHFGENVQQCNFLHTCQFCDMELPSPCALKAHLRLHDNNRLVHARPPYVCPECGLSFPAQASLYQHLLSACVHFSRLVRLKCKMCAEIFSSQYSMRCHLLQHHIEEADHEEEHVSAEYIFACNLCKDVMCHFPTKDCLRKHFSSIQNCYRYKCVICSAGFILLSELCQHINMRHSLHSGPSEQENTNSTKFRPDACLPFNMWQVVRQSSIDVTVSKLLDVRFTPGDEDSYRVLNIWKSFRKKTKSPKNIRVDAFFCPFCGFTPSSIALIKQHLNYHRVWNQPVCQICWRGHFFTEVDYQYHSELHTNKRTSNMKRQNGISQEDPTIKVSEASSSLVKILSSNPILSTSQPALLSHSSSKSDESSSSSSLCDNVSLSSDDEEEDDEGEFAGTRWLNLPPLLFDHDSQDQSSSHQFHTCHLCGLTYRSQEMLRNHYSHAHIGHKNVFVCLVCRKRKKERPFPKKDLLVKHCIRKHRLSAKEAERMVSKEAIQPLMLMPGELFPVPGQQLQQSQNSTARSIAGSKETAPVKRLRVTGDTGQDFVCAKCSFSTGIMGEFRSHIITHRVSNCVQCLECGLSFSVLASLKKHLFMVHRILQPESYVEENQIRMTEPSEEVSTHLDLFQSFHQKELHSLNPEMFHEAIDRPEVKEPQKSENPLECTVCYRGFECESQLKTHMRTHGMAFIRSRRTRKKEHNRNEEETKVGEALTDSSH